MRQWIRQRHSASTEEGFTLIELLVVIVILAILLGIAVSSYLGYRDRANNDAAKANLRTALPAAEAYYSDNGTYVGMNAAALKAINSGLSATLTVAGTPTTSSYCLTDAINGKVWSVKGPGPAASNWYTTNNCT